MKTMDFYLIRAISNLHVGSGEGEFSIVDKQVQRDPVTGLPTIHSSGIKGALREGMETDSDVPATDVIEIFGSKPKGESEESGQPRAPKTMQQGLNNFFEGKLLSLPVRSDHHFYYRATCPLLLQECHDYLHQFNENHPLLGELASLLNISVTEENPIYFGKESGVVRLEDWNATHHDLAIPENLKAHLGDRIAILHDNVFKELAGQLPVIARNYLENGISGNLWYEEVVPREAVFYSIVSRHQDKDGLNTFLSNRNHLVQLGANSTVGYGLCSFKKI